VCCWIFSIFCCRTYRLRNFVSGRELAYSSGQTAQLPRSQCVNERRQNIFTLGSAMKSGCSCSRMEPAWGWLGPVHGAWNYCTAHHPNAQTCEGTKYAILNGLTSPRTPLYFTMQWIIYNRKENWWKIFVKISGIHLTTFFISFPTKDTNWIYSEVQI
jgi:hypothetical protein